jgi:hypothetical protein
VRDALQDACPSGVALESIEVEATPSGPQKAAVRFRGTLRAKEELFAPFQGNLAGVHPEVESIRSRLMERDTTGAINTFVFKKPLSEPLTPAEEQLSALATRLKKLTGSFIVRTSETGQTFPLAGSATATYEFEKWLFGNLAGAAKPTGIGQSRNAFPADALDVNGPEAKAAVAKLETDLSAFESLMEAADTAKAATQIEAASKAAEHFIKELRGAVYDGKAGEAFGDSVPIRITFASKVDWRISADGVVASLKGTIENIDKANGNGIRTITAELAGIGIGENTFTISGNGVPTWAGRGCSQVKG